MRREIVKKGKDEKRERELRRRGMDEKRES